MLIHEYDSVTGLVARPTEEAIERDRQLQLAYVQKLIHDLNENHRALKATVSRQVAA